MCYLYGKPQLVMNTNSVPHLRLDITEYIVGWKALYKSLEVWFGAYIEHEI